MSEDARPTTPGPLVDPTAALPDDPAILRQMILELLAVLRDSMRITNPILMAMLRSPRTDLSVSRRCPHGETRWETT